MLRGFSGVLGGRPLPWWLWNQQASWGLTCAWCPLPSLGPLALLVTLQQGAYFFRLGATNLRQPLSIFLKYPLFSYFFLLIKVSFPAERELGKGVTTTNKTKIKQAKTNQPTNPTALISREIESLFWNQIWATIAWSTNSDQCLLVFYVNTM